MKELKNMFDDFNIHARIIPACISIMPIYIYLLLKNIIDLNFIENFIIKSFIGVLLIALFYRVVRNLGKIYEDRMYKKLGAKPTTIILRYSNNIVDEVSKTRYHKKLNEKIPQIKLPLKKEKEIDEDDIKYESSMNWLRKYANSNRKKEPRTYQELKDYNFWRNLYGTKIIMVLSCIIIIIIECFLVGLENLMDIVRNPYPKYIIILIMFFILILICIVIRKKNMEEKAFDYAKTLLEICDSL